MLPVRAADAAARVSRYPASDGHSASRSSPCGHVAGRWPARPATTVLSLPARLANSSDPRRLFVGCLGRGSRKAGRSISYLVPRAEQREVVRLLYVATRHQVRALAAGITERA